MGAPLFAIAKFGGETDNWTWPRHGCDFAFQRVYVSKDGKSTGYHVDNVPYHPDAYKTIRLSYGTIRDLPLENGTVKPYQTRLSGVIAQADANTGNPDFDLPEKLRKLWESIDFGRYGENGDLPVDFIMDGDVTGGNSGSPLLNAEGVLIGLFFDCN